MNQFILSVICCNSLLYKEVEKDAECSGRQFVFHVAHRWAVYWHIGRSIGIIWFPQFAHRFRDCFAFPEKMMVKAGGFHGVNACFLDLIFE